MQKFSVKANAYPSHTSVSVTPVGPDAQPLSSPVAIPDGEEREFTVTPQRSFLVQVANKDGSTEKPPRDVLPGRLNAKKRR